MNFAVFASGFGSNLQAIINAVKQKKIKANLALIVSDREGSFALKRARQSSIKAIFVDPVLFSDREGFEREVVKHLQKENIDFIVLAGFMRILSHYFIQEYPHKILNIHPSLLPAFRGAHAIKDAFDYGVRVTGATVHFVDEKVDGGPIIAQESVIIRPKETMASLQKRIHSIEHKIYPKVIDAFARGKLKVVGRKVIFSS